MLDWIPAAIPASGRPPLVSLGPTAGGEQRGVRPVLTISPAELNAATKLHVILPITNGGEFARAIGFAVPLSGVKTTGVVRCDQPRVLDLEARSGRKLESVPTPIMKSCQDLPIF